MVKSGPKSGSAEGFTQPEEARWFIGELDKRGIRPNLLAINNGSIHGTYFGASQEGIQLDLTRSIWEAIQPWSVDIAQHGITGTSLDKISSFIQYGIRKGNVGTLWQNIAFGLAMNQNGNCITTADKGIRKTSLPRHPGRTLAGDREMGGRDEQRRRKYQESQPAFRSDCLTRFRLHSRTGLPSMLTKKQSACSKQPIPSALPTASGSLYKGYRRAEVWISVFRQSNSSSSAGFAISFAAPPAMSSAASRNPHSAPIANIPAAFAVFMSVAVSPR